MVASPVPYVRPVLLDEIKKETGIRPSLADLAMLLEMHRNDHQRQQMMELAWRIMRGEFSREAVEETGEEFKVKYASLAVPMREVDLFGNRRLRTQSRLTLISDLSGLGYRVALLALSPKDWLCLDPDFEESARSAGAKKEDFVYITSDEKLAPRISYPRDFFVQIKDTIYLNPEFGHWEWEGLFDYAKGLRRDYSRIGFGGEVVIGDGFAFLSKQYIPPEIEKESFQIQARMHLLEMTTVGETKSTLKRMGLNVYEIPTGWVDAFPPEIVNQLGTSKRFLLPFDHADMQVLHLPVENAVFLSERYYRENRAVLDPMFDQVKPVTFGTLPDEDGLPINSFPLPDGGVYVDSAARQSVKILREAGIEVHTSSQPIGTWGWGMHGGIHCATNVINLPVDYEQT